MRTLLIACASFAVTVSAGCSSGDHTGVSATPPFDPIGTEPTNGDGGSGSTGVFQLFCEQSCANMAAACGNGFGGTYCVQSCLSSVSFFQNCQAQQLAYLGCLATTQIECTWGYPRSPECDPAQQAVSICQSQNPPLPPI